MAQRVFHPLHVSLALTHTHDAAELCVCRFYTRTLVRLMLLDVLENTIQALSVKARNACREEDCADVQHNGLNLSFHCLLS